MALYQHEWCYVYTSILPDNIYSVQSDSWMQAWLTAIANYLDFFCVVHATTTCAGWEAAGSRKGLLWLVLTADQRQRTDNQNYWWAGHSRCALELHTWLVLVHVSHVQPLPSWTRCVRTSPPQSWTCGWTWFCILSQHRQCYGIMYTQTHQFTEEVTTVGRSSPQISCATRTKLLKFTTNYLLALIHSWGFPLCMYIWISALAYDCSLRDE